jgi:hypothetical protein
MNAIEQAIEALEYMEKKSARSQYQSSLCLEAIEALQSQQWEAAAWKHYKENIIDAIEGADWSGVSIGNKALIAATIELLRDKPHVPNDVAKDAQRWRWIRDGFKFVPSLDENGSDWSGPELDALVDGFIADALASQETAKRQEGVNNG